MIFYVIFGDFVGWDWPSQIPQGNPRHIAIKTPLEKLNQNLGLADPPPSVGTKDQIFPMILFEGSPKC